MTLHDAIFEIIIFPIGPSKGMQSMTSLNNPGSLPMTNRSAHSTKTNSSSKSKTEDVKENQDSTLSPVQVS